MTLSIASPAFSAGEAIPSRYTCSGDDVPPPLAWSGVPAVTKSLAIICADPDAPGATFYHWGIYGLPPDLRSIPEAAALPKGARSVRNSFGSAGYRGPCPPKGHGIHHYRFQLFALSVAQLEPGSAADCKHLLAALGPHVIARAETVGTFYR